MASLQSINILQGVPEENEQLTDSVGTPQVVRAPPSRKVSLSAGTIPPSASGSGSTLSLPDGTSLSASTSSGSTVHPPLPHPVLKKSSSRSATKESKGNEVRVRLTPHLHVHNAEPASPTLMYWSRAPTWGNMPSRPLRAHSVTMIDNVAWVFGGCDDKGCYKDVWLLDIDSLEWTKPNTIGDMPPSCRAHTATAYDKKLYIFGGGAGSIYYQSLYILDTVTRRWTHPRFPPDVPLPAPRRAHSAVIHEGKLIVFGGGNGTNALNDVWTLDLRVPPERMVWQELETWGDKPTPRGYHTANIVAGVMVIVGGSDGKNSYQDIYCLHLATRRWSTIRPNKEYRRLAHTSVLVGSYLFIVGGHDGSKYLGDLLLFNLQSLQYEPRMVLGKPPYMRGYHASVLADSRLWVFGGFNGTNYFDDVYILDLAGAAYLPQVTSFTINGA